MQYSHVARVADKDHAPFHRCVSLCQPLWHAWADAVSHLSVAGLHASRPLLHGDRVNTFFHHA